MLKLTDVDPAVGPEMKSTGEVMGVDVSLGAALQKAFVGASGAMPTGGGVLCSIADADKAEALPILLQLCELGFTVHATAGTAAALSAAGIPAQTVAKIGHGRPNVIDVINDGHVSLVLNSVSHVDTDELDATLDGTVAPSDERRRVKDGYRIRVAAEARRIPCCTSLDTAAALVDAMVRDRAGEPVAVATVRAYRDGAAVGDEVSPRG